MKKTINVSVVRDGQRYFSIYKVVCVKPDGERCIYSEFLTYKMALDAKDFVYNHLSSSYVCCYVTESLVWC